MLWLATWFGTGFAPIAPGTVATIATLPLHFVLLQLSPALHAAAILGIFIIAVVSSHHVAHQRKLKDPQIVVIDESIGVLLALWISGSGTIGAMVAAVILFRLLDIYKPWPIHIAEDLPHVGLAIVMDDVVAGIGAGVLVIAGSWAIGALL